jgi:hypothetical protein
MTRVRVFVLAIAALLLEVLPLVAAHGDENDVPMDNAQQDLVDNDGASRSYWSLSEHATLMYWHIALEILAWIVILPVGEFSSIIFSLR